MLDVELERDEKFAREKYLMKRDDEDVLVAILRAPSFSRFSPTGDGEVPGAVELRKSSALPGDFGVFAEEPKEAKAPDPSPNAEEAPDAVGEEMLFVVSGETPLNGLCLA